MEGSLFQPLVPDGMGLHRIELHTIKDHLDRILACSNRLDSVIRLRIEGQRSRVPPRPIRVARYDTEFEFFEADGLVGVIGEATPDELELEIIPLWKPRLGPATRPQAFLG